MLKLIGKLTPAGKLLMALGVLVLVWVVAVLVITAVGSTTLRGNTSYRDPEPYAWSGEPLLVERYERNRPATCTIRPEDGEPRDVQAARSRRTLTTYPHDTLEPWFRGSATITCNRDVKVYEGGIAALRGYYEGHLFTLTIALGVVVPLFGAFVVSGLRGSRRT